MISGPKEKIKNTTSKFKIWPVDLNIENYSGYNIPANKNLTIN